MEKEGCCGGRGQFEKRILRLFENTEKERLDRKVHKKFVHFFVFS